MNWEENRTAELNLRFCENDEKRRSAPGRDRARRHFYWDHNNNILPDITFEVNKTELSQTVKPLLDSLALYLQSNPQYQLSVNGHTDNTGSEQANLLLSQNRAKAVHDYISSQGIKPERISIKGYGSSLPVSDNNTEEGRAQNRRVEIIICEM